MVAKRITAWLIAWATLVIIIANLPRPTHTDKADLFPNAPWIAPARQVRAAAAKLLCEKYSLQPIGMGGMLMEGVKKLSLKFQASHELTHDEARRLVVLCVEDFLALVNADPEIRPYLIEYPLPQSAVSVGISSPCRAASAQTIPYLSIAWTFEDLVCIAYDDAESEHRTFKEVIEEPYEEALAIVKAQEKERMTQATTAKGTLSDP